MDKTPIYKYPASYARENNELPQYRASMQSLARCKAAIEAVISEQWTGMGFPDDAAKGVLKEFGPEKVSLVLSYTVREKEHDKRISGHNRDWAKMVLPYRLQPGHSQITLESHSAKLDIFLDVAQKNILEMEQEKKANRSATRRSATKRKTVKPSKEPIYKEKFAYAQAHDECAQYNTSMEVNVACKDAIESAIREHYADNCFDSVPAVHEVVKRFGYDRMLYVLANSIQRLDHDGRISRQNIKWAWTVPVVQEKQWLYIVTSHPGLLNIFAQTARHEHLLSQPLKRADIKAEAGVISEICLGRPLASWEGREKFAGP